MKKGNGRFFTAGLYIDNFISCPVRYLALSAHPARLARGNAAELEAGAGNGTGRGTGKTFKKWPALAGWKL